MLAVTDDANLSPTDHPVPAPGPGEVLVRVEYAGVNRADLSQVAGNYPPPPGASSILGLEVSGTRVDTGKRVMALLTSGGYAQYVAVPEEQVMSVPEGIDQERAAAIPESLATAWSNLVDILKVGSCDTVLIQGGSGSLGTFAVQLARELGANVLATAGGPDRCRQVEELGATAIDHRGDVAEQVKHHAPDGVDAILDIVGSDVGQMLKLLALDGRIAIISLQGGTKAEIPVGLVMVKRLSVLGSTLRSRPKEGKVEIIRDAAEFALPRLADGRIVPFVDRAFPLGQAKEAHEHVRSGSPFGKVVLRI